jgi:hypothetical protein
MLKPVVQHKTIHRQSPQDPLAERIPVRPHRHDGLRAAARDQIGLVSGLVRPHQHLLSVGDQQLRSVAATPIPAAQNRHAFALCRQSLHQVHDDRRFACATDGEVPDADDGTR